MQMRQHRLFGTLRLGHRDRPHGARSSVNFPNTLLDADHLNAERIYAAGMRGDELALTVLKKMGTYLGVGLANLVNLLNPEIIVIGGGVANGWKLFERYSKQDSSRSTPSGGQFLPRRSERADACSACSAQIISNR